MHDTNANIITYSNEVGINLSKKIEDYSEILKLYDLEFQQVDYYLQVGESTKVQGWILHISVVISQMVDMLQAVLPFLIQNNVPFKVVMNKEIANCILGGDLGIEQLGKLICIYPDNDENATQLAIQLIALTQSFKGPDIPTDIYLGGVIHARYGSINPLILSDAYGKRGKYIYSHTGQLKKDPYTVPFQLADGIGWPFGNLASPIPPVKKKILKHIYKPLILLKEDIKGNVYKGIYLKGLFRVAPCIIKEGRKNMNSDQAGRDMYHRLAWQYELHQDLVDIIPIPKIYDFFIENDNAWLIMEFVKGISLYDYLKQINLNIKSWREIAPRQKEALLVILIQIVDIIERLHQKGYVHRDVAPGNFLINQQGQLTLIDMELAYSINKNKPSPAFVLGTPGFISPEQRENYTPTINQDIYGIGALLLTVFTGLYPTKFNTQDPQLLINSLELFIGNSMLAHLIADCLNHEPLVRPDIRTIKSALEAYRGENIQKTETVSSILVAKINYNLLQQSIQAAVNGLVHPPIVMGNDLWYSKVATSENGIIQKEYTRYGGLHEGISGVLYLLARVKRMGYAIDTCKKNYYNGWKFIEQEYFKLLPEIAPGLYGGAAGIAISLGEGIRAGLLENTETNRHVIQQCLSLPTASLDLATGVTGQGIALLQCASYMNNEYAGQLLIKIIHMLLDTQQKDGSWFLKDNTKDKVGKKKISFGYGISGIIWFLHEYSIHYADPKVKQAAIKALHWLLKTTHQLKGLFKAKVFNKIIGEERERGDERKGVILTCIKAFEVWQDDHLKKVAEEALTTYPQLSVKNNYSLDTGLAGLGELYLEAWRVFKNEEWLQRAAWIAQIYLHTSFNKPEGHLYWRMNEYDEPTADFMTGNSGIIHFLLRNIDHTQVGYRILK